MEFDMTKMVEKITMQVEENQEEFIFETIYPYCENILQMKINKEELKQILLNGKRNLQSCDDCITKAKVINTIHKTIYGFFDIADDDSEKPINDKDKLLLTINKAISNAVKALPSVTPSRPKGKWIVLREEYKFMGGIVNESRGCKCSNCNKVVRFKSVFCPNCGADMRESEDK